MITLLIGLQEDLGYNMLVPETKNVKFETHFQGFHRN